MATTTLVANPALVTAPDTNSNTIVFDAVFNDIMSPINVATIEIVSGTFKFNTMGNSAAGGASYTTAGTKLVVSFKSNTGIQYQATTAGDTFRISF